MPPSLITSFSGSSNNSSIGVPINPYLFHLAFSIYVLYTDFSFLDRRSTMDKITKQILEEIKNSDEQVIYFSGIEDPFCDIASTGTVEASLEFLTKNHYIDISKDTSDILLKISISYRALHPIRYCLKLCASYLCSNWIAIAALIISIIALTKQ